MSKHLSIPALLSLLSNETLALVRARCKVEPTEPAKCIACAAHIELLRRENPKNG